MILISLALSASIVALEPQVAEAVQRWSAVVEDTRKCASVRVADAAIKMRCLIEVDEVARQYLWVVEDRRLSSEQQRKTGETIGPLLNEIDAFTTRELKTILPISGWFDNRIHGRQITHGAWLIAQHSPDATFRVYALSKMSMLVKSGGVDARDYALTWDRVQVHKGLPQRYGSQSRCLAGSLTLLPIENERAVDDLRETIGWSQTLAETKGDAQIGKPCVM